MAKKCKETKNNGQPCEGYALTNSEYCYAHDPAYAGERAAARKLGGLNRKTRHGGDVSGVPHQVRTLTDVLLVLDYTLAETLVLENGITRGRLIVAIANTYIEAIKTGELESRILAIESALKAREVQK